MIIRNEIIKNAKKHKIKMKPKQHLFFPNIVFIEEHTVLNTPRNDRGLCL